MNEPVELTGGVKQGKQINQHNRTRESKRCKIKKRLTGSFTKVIFPRLRIKLRKCSSDQLSFESVQLWTVHRPRREGGGGTSLLETNGDVPLDEVAFS